MIRVALLTIFLAVPAAQALAQGPGGTPDEQAACRPDTRKFCRQVKPGSDSNVFLSCLQANRTKLSASCRKVLDTHGA
jgi:hypothetical protein